MGVRADESRSFTVGEDIWRKRPYKKGEKVWHVKPGFLNWIPYGAEYSMSLGGGGLSFGGDSRDGLIFRIPYRQLNMLPGNKYTLSVKFSTDGGKTVVDCGAAYYPEDPPEWHRIELYPRLQIACGRKFEAFAGFYEDLYAKAVSSGLSDEEEASAVVDFTGCKGGTPGVAVIGVLAVSPGVYPGARISRIRVYNETSGKEAYLNDFASGGYTAAKDTEAEPGVSGDWVKAGADE
jgi:rRNA maturation protein Nop10